jgi:hypothetical protein
MKGKRGRPKKIVTGIIGLNEESKITVTETILIKRNCDLEGENKRLREIIIEDYMKRILAK